MRDRGGPFLILVGPPGSGKSTWARRHFPREAIVSLDNCRRLVSGDVGDQAATPAAVRVLEAVVLGRLQHRMPIVIDATNLHDEHQSLASSGYGHDCPPVAVVFDTPLDVCLERNSRRPRARRVPDGFIREAWGLTREVLSAGRLPGFDLTVHVVHDDGAYVEGFVLRGYREQSWLVDARPDYFNPDFSVFRSRRCAALASTGTGSSARQDV